MDGIGGKLPRATKVKNKQPSDRQITAEQILREAKELQLEDGFKPTKQYITDQDELDEYRLRNRKTFEDNARRVGRFDMSVWVKYATFEEAQKDFRRARSVWERALAINSRYLPFWLKYAEMEMRHRFVNHARNVWDRAVTMLPRVDSLWYKYVHMEEMLGNVPNARGVFERWMSFEPDHNAWHAYIKMEMRYKEVDHARGIFERYVICLPTVKAFTRYAKFEAKNGASERARAVFERAIGELGEDGQTEDLFLPFADFEERSKEMERARAIFKYALDNVPKSQAEGLFQKFVQFEKRHGDRDGIEAVITGRKRFEYDDLVRKNPHGYDTWFDYIRLEEASGDIERTREVYNRAVANLPPAPEKSMWQRYIYLWINWALFEELEAEDVEATRAVYKQCLGLVPHSQFTFAKVWIMAAHFEVRQKNLPAARKILGQAIGMAPKGKIFTQYIELEMQLGHIDRCRKLYEKYVEWDPACGDAWCKWAELEASLGESDRTRALYQLAIQQPVLDAPEVVWKAAIDYEISLRDRPAARALYESLLQRTQHVKVWLSYAAMEATPEALMGADEDEDEDEEARELRVKEAAAAETSKQRAQRVSSARSVYERAFRSLRTTNPDAKEEAVMLLEAWRAFEEGAAEGGDEDLKLIALSEVDKKMPKRVKRKRAITLEDGTPAGMEEYFDYIFPEEENANRGLKLLQAAQKWKKQKTAE